MSARRAVPARLRRSLFRLVPALAAVLAASGCQGDATPADQAPEEGGAAILSSRPSSEAIPDRFGVGRAASEAEIAALDIDVMPDGTGLPPGRGTVAEGAELYAAGCASCHGADLREASLGPLVPSPDFPMFPDGDVPASARAIGNYWPYATTLFDYVRRAMPYDRPGSLRDDEVYALVAYLLWRNGIVEEDAVMDPETLPDVVMPARGRFVVDDRLESNRVR